MTNETVTAITTIRSPAETVFAVLADPTNHVGIDGTGWVHESLDGADLTETGQIFRMAMYHQNHPDGHYEMANKVRVFEPPRAISWEPGQEVTRDGNLEFGGWIWRYDLSPISQSETAVTLSYDWSATPQLLRDQIQFPPFDSGHLDNSLTHLAEIVASKTAPDR